MNYLVREGFQAEHVREGMEIYGKDIQKVRFFNFFFPSPSLLWNN